MASAYEVRRGDQLFGPFNSAQLKEMANQNRLLRNDQIRKIGTETWNPADRFANLFPDLATSSSPLITTTHLPPVVAVPPVPSVPLPATSQSERTPNSAIPPNPVAASTAEPISSASSSTAPRTLPNFARWGPPIALALIAGLLFSLLKPAVGPVGLLLMASGVGLLLGLGVGLLNMNAASLAKIDPEHPVALETRRRAKSLALSGGLGVALLALLSLIEFATPEAGLTRSLLGGGKDPIPVADIPPPAEPEPSVDPTAWASADFVLLGPENAAIALQFEPATSRFRVLARESGKPVLQAQKIAWDRGTQLIDTAPDLAQQLLQLPPEGVISGRLQSELQQIWRTHQYVPRDMPLVAFDDLKRNQRRFGFVADRQADQVSFIPLTPTPAGKNSGGSTVQFVTETIRRQDVRPVTHRYNFNHTLLKDSDDKADLLDYCVFRILTGLSTAPDQARYVRVAVAMADYDRTGLENIRRDAEIMRQTYLAEMKIKADGGVLNEKGKRSRQAQEIERTLRQGSQLKETQQQSFSEFLPSNGNSYGADPYGLNGTDSSTTNTATNTEFTESGITQRDIQEVEDFLVERQIDGDREAKALLNQLIAEKTRLQNQEKEVKPVTAELRAKLLAAGVSVVERDALAAIDNERKLWERSDFKSASDQKLLGASHIVITEIQDRRGNNEYRLAVRLVDVRSGQIVDEVVGERTPPERLPQNAIADTPFVLLSGQPVLIEFASNVRPRTSRDLRAYPGGYPLRLPPIELVARTTQDVDLEFDRLRLIKIFGMKEPGQVKSTANVKGLVGRPAHRPLPEHLAKHQSDLPLTPEGLHVRIGFIDDLNYPLPSQSPYQAVLNQDLTDPATRSRLPFQTVPYRDLFGQDIQDLPLEGIARIRPLSAESDLIPGAHHMRYATFRIAAAVLPQAGRVAREERGVRIVSLGHRNGLRPNDRLQVHRLGTNDRLEAELGIREIQDNLSVVSYNPDDYLFPEAYDPTIGDIVYPKPDRPIAVSFAPPQGSGDAVDLAGQVVDSLISALRSLNIQIVDRNQASHMISVSLDSPRGMVAGDPPRQTKYPLYGTTIKVIDLKNANASLGTNITLDIEEPEALNWDH